MHQQLGSDMVTSPSFSDMKHHVPNEGITVEASRPAWPIENPDCMHALRWMRCGNVPEPPDAAREVPTCIRKSLSRPPPPQRLASAERMCERLFFWKWTAQARQGDPCHRFRKEKKRKAWQKSPQQGRQPDTLTAPTYVVLDWAFKNSARLKGPQFIPHELDLTHSPRMGIIIFISSLLNLPRQYSHFCIACNVLRPRVLFGT
ncbi:hypothetical protein PgNI_05982 [Pyricularia grisea]|uniref:Uncharacterized protein n=1 Tax=Pyricularia grisea TaxID=148305 RepID=A0A6P8B6F0_PYRGI|nr:hypothetical protein PgNI_05982 [Pyricularia grisea]TLD10833.1 hypothetical protein PgNI_05982 [Pyricularia grisea]